MDTYIHIYIHTYIHTYLNRAPSPTCCPDGGKRLTAGSRMSSCYSTGRPTPTPPRRRHRAPHPLLRSLRNQTPLTSFRRRRLLGSAFQLRRPLNSAFQSRHLLENAFQLRRPLWSARTLIRCTLRLRPNPCLRPERPSRGRFPPSRRRRLMISLPLRKPTPG